MKKLEEVSVYCGIDQNIVIHYIEEEWVQPFNKEEFIFDDEDVARITLICELKDDLGVNEEAIPIILRLVDQLNLLHVKLRS